MEARVTFAATHDELTGLPNRALFRDRLGQALALARRGGGGRRCCCSTWTTSRTSTTASATRPATRCCAASRGGSAARSRGSDTLARLGGDEFALVQRARAGRARRGHARRQAAGRPGGAVRPRRPGGARGGERRGRRCPRGRGRRRTSWSARRPGALPGQGEGRGRFRFFEPAMDEEVRARRRLQQELRAGAGAGAVAAALPAAARAGRGARRPASRRCCAGGTRRAGWCRRASSCRSAEASGLIVPLGAWALREACRQAAAWRCRASALTVAVNVSPVQLRHPDLLRRGGRGPGGERARAGAARAGGHGGLLVESDGGVAGPPRRRWRRAGWGWRSTTSAPATARSPT